MISERIINLSNKLELSLKKESKDIYENQNDKSYFHPGDLVSYLKQEATYITNLPNRKALINLSGTRPTDFKEVDENHLKLIESRHQRKTHRHLPAPSTEVLEAPKFDAATIPSATKPLSDLELYRLETRAVSNRFIR